jgi:superfamily II RNA helicase
MAILLAMARNMRAFYTTPLKALSNQKFSDFKRLFGEDRVGLLTGDVNVNRDAPIIVMTTEVYRNMLYADGPSAAGTGDATFAMDNVATVTFDEFHYLSVPDRGTVWEESVVNSPNHVLLVALSATMKNTGDVREWFEDVQGPTALVESDHRPVPLNFSFCHRDGILPLFHGSDKGGDRGARDDKRRGRGRGERGKKKDVKPKLHPALLASVVGGSAGDRGRGRHGDRGRDRGRGGGDGAKDFESVLRDYDRTRRAASRSGGGRPRQSYRDRMSSVPSYPYVVRSLRRRDMLPAIVFIFSRAGCDRAANEATSVRDPLVTAQEETSIRKRVDAFCEEHPGLVNDERIGLVRQGVASHHAGLLPLWKAFVEELFQDGLVKVVFATETLAAGINMPARTTVISTMSKRRGDEGIVQLSTSEVLQMAGRAGRRGKDTAGYSVIMQSPFEGPIEAFRTVTSDVDALRSHFTPSYGMVLNLLHTRSMDDARSLVERSFGAFLRRKAERTAAARRPSAPLSDGDGDAAASKFAANELAALQQVAAEAERTVAAVDESDLRRYISAMERVKAERRALRYVLRQSRETDTQLVEDTLAFAPPGTRVKLRGARAASGKSKGAYRRQKRRVLTAAIAAAGRGEGCADLRSYYLDGAEEEDVEELDDGADGPATDRRSIEGILLDIGPDFGVSILFAAVCEDGQMYLFTHEQVERLDFDADAVDVDAVAPEWRLFEYPERSRWTCIGVDHYIAPLPAELAPVAALASEFAAQRDAQLEQEAADPRSPSALAAEERAQNPEMHAQRERLAYAKTLVTGHPLHERPEAHAALRARRALAQIQAEVRDREGGGPVGRRPKRKGRKRGDRTGVPDADDSVGDVPAAAEAGAVDYESGVFGEFVSIVQVAKHYGFLDSDDCVTALGEVGAKIRADNEVWATIALMEPALEESSPVHLAAVMAAVLSEGMRGDSYVAYQPSPEACQLIADLAPLRARLLAVQDEAGVDFPVGLEMESVGLVEAWASGDSWVDVLSQTSLQEGDICRILRRVLDLLRQIPHLPFVSDAVKLNAKRAVALFDRFPVVDNRTYQVRASERAPGVPVKGEEGAREQREHP